MEIKIVWSKLAENQLKSIFDYYSKNVSFKVAQSITNNIINKVSILETNPLIGTKEDMLAEYPEDFRYLIESNYKIIYWVDDQDVSISVVFDCRQNPTKIKKLITE